MISIKEPLQENGKFRIVFLGDSITSAEWVHPNWTEIIEYVLKEELQVQFNDWKIPSWGIKCINSGLDGSSTNDLLSELDSEVFFYKPDLVIIVATSNDSVLGVSVEDHVGNLKRIFDRIFEKGIKIAFATDISSGNERYNLKYLPYIEEVKKIFPYKGALFVNLFEEFSGYNTQEFFTFVSQYNNTEVGIGVGEIDFIHPNPLGNAYIAKILLEGVFGIKFDPDRYIQENNSGKMFPSY